MAYIIAPNDRVISFNTLLPVLVPLSAAAPGHPNAHINEVRIEELIPTNLSDVAAARQLLNNDIRSGSGAFPQEVELDADAFQRYFLSHHAFVVKAVVPDRGPPPHHASVIKSEAYRGPGEGLAPPPPPSRLPSNPMVNVPTPPLPGGHSPLQMPVPHPPVAVQVSVHAVRDEEVVGTFYIKPNFPGRSSHIANAGFVVAPSMRRRGIGTCMANQFCKLARHIGYRAAMFNLVYSDNVASVNMWRKLGFVELCRIPNAGHPMGHNQYHCDAIQFYRELHVEDPREARTKVTVGIKRPVEMAQLPATGNASKRRKASTRFQTEESLISHRLDSTKRHLPTQVNAVLGIRQGDCRVCSLAGYRSKTTKACSECQEPLCGQTKKRDNHIAPCWTIWHQHKDMIHAIRSQPEYFKSGVRRGAEQLV